MLDKPTKPKDLKVILDHAIFLPDLFKLETKRICPQVSDIHKEGCTLEWKPPDDNGTFKAKLI